MSWKRELVPLPAVDEERLKRMTNDELIAGAGSTIMYAAPSGDFVAVLTTNASMSKKRCTCAASRHRRKDRGIRGSGRTGDSQKKDHVGRTYLMALRLKTPLSPFMASRVSKSALKKGTLSRARSGLSVANVAVI